ncbi:MAG: serine hydrolase [Verrucomicrobiota bacterium]
MKPVRSWVWSAVLSASAFAADAISAGAPGTPTSVSIHVLVDRAAQQTVEKFSGIGLKADELAVTLVDLTDPARWAQASFRGSEPIYPASVVKLFYLVAAHRWLEDGRLTDTPELHRALSDMVVESYNEATHYVVDVLTGTTSGPELPESELAVWHEKRGAVNRYFRGLGYTGINADKKPWCEGPYGREVQAIRAFKPDRNQLTTAATARLLAEIATGTAVSAKRSAEMRELLARDIHGAVKDPEDQTHGFTGIALREIPGSKVWSKAGWTRQTRHDAAYMELVDGRKFVLVTFTTGHANERGIIPAVARTVVAGLRR